MTLFKAKFKSPKDNTWGCFGDKRALFGLVANEFAARIRNSCYDPLTINGARETLDRSCHKEGPQQEGDNSKSWLGFLVGDRFIFDNNILEIFL